MNQSIEKHQGAKDFSPHYTLEITLSCRNCGTFKERWMAASDGPTAFPFILTMCEYCGCFRFDAVLHAKFFDNKDEKNVVKAKSRLDKEILADSVAQERLTGPKVIKKVEGERVDLTKSPHCNRKVYRKDGTTADEGERVDIDGVALCSECGQGYDCVCSTEPDEVKIG